MAQTRDLLALVPPRVEVMAYIRNVPATVEKLRGSPFQAFYTDPAAGDFFGPLRQSLESQSRELGAVLGAQSASPDSIVSAMTGGLLVATIPKSAAVKGAGHLVIYEHNGTLADPAALRPRRPGAFVRRVPAKAGPFTYERLITTYEIHEEIRGGKKRSERRRGSAVDSALAMAKRQVVTEEAFFANDALVIYAANSELMKEALERLAAPGKAASLASTETHTAALTATGGVPDIEVYAHLENWADGKFDESLFGGDADATKLGLREIKSAALGLSFAPDRFEAQLAVYAPEPRQGIGRLLFMNQPLRADEATAHPFLGIVPADAVGYSVFRSDLGALWSEFRRVLREGAPQVGDLFDVYFRSLEQGSAMNLERDLFGGLGGYWGSFTRAAAGTDRTETTYAAAIRDAKTFAPALRAWILEMGELLNYEVKESAVGGYPCLHLVGAEVSRGAFIGIEQLANVCIADGWVFLSSKPEHIEAALAQMKNPAPLLHGPDHARATGEMPGDRFFETFVASGGFGPMLNSPMTRIVTGLMGGAGGSMLNLSAPPDPALWRRHFGPAGGAARKTRDAVTTSFFILYAEQSAAR